MANNFAWNEKWLRNTWDPFLRNFPKTVFISFRIKYHVITKTNIWFQNWGFATFWVGINAVQSVNDAFRLEMVNASRVLACSVERIFWIRQNPWPFGNRWAGRAVNGHGHDLFIHKQHNCWPKHKPLFLWFLFTKILCFWWV